MLFQNNYVKRRMNEGKNVQMGETTIVIAGKQFCDKMICLFVSDSNCFDS